MNKGFEEGGSNLDRDELSNCVWAPGVQADSLLTQCFGVDAAGFSSDIDAVLRLVPVRVHILLGRNEAGDKFWCDLGGHPIVQGWGATPAAAVSAAVYLYKTHEPVDDDERSAMG